MGSSIKALAQTRGTDRVFLGYSFRPRGTSAPTDLKGLGLASVTRNSVGLYTMVFDEAYFDELAFVAGVRAADATLTHVQLGDFVAASKSLQVRTYSAGVLADLADDTDNVVSLLTLKKNTSGV